MTLSATDMETDSACYFPTIFGGDPAAPVCATITFYPKLFQSQEYVKVRSGKEDTSSNNSLVRDMVRDLRLLIRTLNQDL